MADIKTADGGRGTAAKEGRTTTDHRRQTTDQERPRTVDGGPHCRHCEARRAAAAPRLKDQKL